MAPGLYLTPSFYALFMYLYLYVFVVRTIPKADHLQAVMLHESVHASKFKGKYIIEKNERNRLLRESLREAYLSK